LRNNIQSTVDIANGIVTISDILEREETMVPERHIEELKKILSDMSNGSVIAAIGGTEYDQAKQEILSILPPNVKVDIESIFSQIENKESGPESKESIKSLLDSIVKKIVDSAVVNIQDQ